VADADRFIEDGAAMLGSHPGRSILPVRWTDPLRARQDPNVSCVINGTVYANVWIHFHELVHAIDDTYPPALFVEGSPRR
jgi:hypothetical protein